MSPQVNIFAISALQRHALFWPERISPFRRSAENAGFSKRHRSVDFSGCIRTACPRANIGNATTKRHLLWRIFRKMKIGTNKNKELDVRKIQQLLILFSRNVIVENCMLWAHFPVRRRWKSRSGIGRRSGFSECRYSKESNRMKMRRILMFSSFSSILFCERHAIM